MSEVARPFVWTNQPAWPAMPTAKGGIASRQGFVGGQDHDRNGIRLVEEFGCPNPASQEDHWRQFPSQLGARLRRRLGQRATAPGDICSFGTSPEGAGRTRSADGEPEHSILYLSGI